MLSSQLHSSSRFDAVPCLLGDKESESVTRKKAAYGQEA